MFSFVLRRLASAVPTLFIVVTISFFLMRFAPGGPFNLERPLPPADHGEPDGDLPARQADLDAISHLSSAMR